MRASLVAGASAEGTSKVLVRWPRGISVVRVVSLISGSVKGSVVGFWWFMIVFW